MSGICTDYYYVEIDGVKSVVSRIRTKIEESWFNFDGTEITDESVISSLQKQATDDNHIDSGKAFYETLNKVEWTKFPKEGNENRKGILLNKGDIIVFQDETGHQYVLAQMNDWNVADFGSSELPFNINSTKRPTVQYPGESGDEAHEIAYLEDIKSDYVTSLLGTLSLPEGTTTSQIIPALEESYVSDLGNPVRIDGKPYDENSNNYEIGATYFSLAWLEGEGTSFTFYYELFTPSYRPLGLYMTALLGAISQHQASITELKKCCEGSTEPEPEPEPTYEYKYDFNDFWANGPHAEIVSNSEIHINGKTNRTICGYTIQNLGLTNFSCELEVSGIEKVKEVYPDFYLSIYTNTGSPESGVILQDGDNSVNLDFDSSSLTIFITPVIDSEPGQTVTFGEPVVINQKPINA